MAKKTSEQTDSWAVGWVIRALVVVIFAAAILVPLGGIPIIAVATQTSGAPLVSVDPITIRLGNPTPIPTPIPVTPTPHIYHVGIVVGHRNSDSGAVCPGPNGLQEVQVNTQVARYVELIGNEKGWQVELLDEFDQKLTGYQADVLLSIHADSCDVQGKSGFKVARAASSYIPEEEDILVRCVSDHYAQVTGLQFDANTITPDMTYYHSFDEIARETPAAIIEIGFMLDDQDLMVNQPDLLAQGIVDGLECFLQGLDQ